MKLPSPSPLLLSALFIVAVAVNAAPRAQAQQQPAPPATTAPAPATPPDTTAPTTISGNWQLSWTDQTGDATQALFQITQNGSKLSGSFEGKRGSVPLTGKLQGTQVTLTIKIRRRHFSFSGTVDGNKMTGTTEQGKSWTATRQ